jgi:hypothetical protein
VAVTVPLSILPTIVPLLRSSTLMERPWSRIAPDAALNERSKLAGAPGTTVPGGGT